jgi:hypothetical protein
VQTVSRGAEKMKHALFQLVCAPRQLPFQVNITLNRFQLYNRKVETIPFKSKKGPKRVSGPSSTDFNPGYSQLARTLHEGGPHKFRLMLVIKSVPLIYLSCLRVQFVLSGFGRI